MINAILGFLGAILAYLFLQNRNLKRKAIDAELKNEKETLDDAQKKTNNARDRFLDLLNKYRKGE